MAHLRHFIYTYFIFVVVISITVSGFFNFVTGSDTANPANTNQLSPKSGIPITPDIKLLVNGSPRLSILPPTEACKHGNAANRSSPIHFFKQRTAKALEIKSELEETTVATPPADSNELTAPSKTDTSFQDLSSPSTSGDQTVSSSSTQTSSSLLTSPAADITSEQSLIIAKTTFTPESTTKQTVPNVEITATTKSDEETQEIVSTVSISTSEITPIVQELATVGAEAETTVQESEITTQEIKVKTHEINTTAPEAVTTEPEAITTKSEAVTTEPETDISTQDINVKSHTTDTTTLEAVTSEPNAEISTQDIKVNSQDVDTTSLEAVTTDQDAEISTQDIKVKSHDVDTTVAETVTTDPDAVISTQDIKVKTHDSDTTAPEAVTSKPEEEEHTTSAQEKSSVAETIAPEIAANAIEIPITTTEVISIVTEKSATSEISTTFAEKSGTLEIINSPETTDVTKAMPDGEKAKPELVHSETEVTSIPTDVVEDLASTTRSLTTAVQEDVPSNLETTTNTETKSNSYRTQNSIISLIPDSTTSITWAPEVSITESHTSSIPEVTFGTLDSTSGSPMPHLVPPPKSSDSKTNLVGQQEPSVMARNESSHHPPMDDTTISSTMRDSDTWTSGSATAIFRVSSSPGPAVNSSDTDNGTQPHLNLPNPIRTKVERMLGDQLPFGFGTNNKKNEADKDLEPGINNVKNSITNSSVPAFETIRNFATLSIEQIKNFPIEAFAAIKEKALKAVNSDQAKTIMERLKTAENTSLWRRTGEILKEKLDPSYIVSLMSLAPSKLGPSLAGGMVQSLGHRLGLTTTWNSSLVESLGPSVLLLLPPDIMRIKDKEAKVIILGILWNSDTFRNKSQVQTDDEVLLTSLIQDVYGPVEKWSFINRTMAKYLPKMAPLIINKIRTEVVNTSLSVIGGVDFYDRAHAQPIISKAMKSINFNAIGLPEAQEFFHSMGKLISYLRFEDMEAIPRRILENDDVLATLARNSNMDKELARWILSINQPTTGEWTKSDVIRLHFFLQYSSGRLLKQLENQSLLDREIVATILKRPDLELGQLHAIKDMAISFYKHDEQWDIETAPVGVLPMLLASEIGQQRPEDVVNNLDKFNQVVESLDASQKMAVANKLVELGLRRTLRARNHVHPDFLSLISTTDIRSLAESDQLELLQNLPIDSPQVKNYINDRLNSNITLETFRKDALMAKSCTCEMLEKFEPEETMELLVALRSSSGGCPLQYKTAKCFVEKLKSHLSTLPVEINEGDDETKLLSTLKESELAIVGGEIFIHFSSDSLQDQHPPSRCLQIFSLIGQLPLSIINLLQPYEKKQQLARASLNCLDKQEDIMGLSEMMTIGNLMGYLPEISIDKLGSEAFALNLPHLLGGRDTKCQQHPLSGSSIKPCLNLGLRNAIRRKLPLVFESPAAGCETVVQSIGCLLSTLYHDQLRDIKDRALLASIDKLNECWDNEHAPNQDDKSDIYVTFCNKELLSTAITIHEAERQLKIRLKNAALGDIAQLSRKRRIAYLASAASLRLTCDVIRRANSAITEVTLDELDSMDDNELRDCLEDVGKYPMSLAKANFLWGRVKKAYNSSASEIDYYTYHQMGFIMQAIGIEEISTLSLNNTSTISVFGMDRSLNLEQLRELASEVKTDYQADASRYTPSDLVTFGNIICGFAATDLEKIPTKYFTEVVYRLGDTIATCHSETRKALALLAVEGFGHPRNWTSATVTSVGSIVGGLEPKVFSAIPGRSFDGLKANYVKTIPPSSIKNLAPHQFGNFSVEAINYLTEAQLSQLNSEQLLAVNQLKSLYGRGTAVSRTGWMLPLLVTAVLIIV